MMGKGKPAPRETAKEKKTSAQKAAPAKAPGKKAVAAPQSKKAQAPRKAQKPEPEKAAAATGSSERARTAKAESAETQTRPPGTQTKPPAASSTGESAVQKQPVHAPPAPAGQRQHEAQAAGSEELEGMRLPVAAGKVGVFGGPRDRSVKPDDKLGLP